MGAINLTFDSVNGWDNYSTLNNIVNQTNAKFETVDQLIIDASGFTPGVGLVKTGIVLDVSLGSGLSLSGDGIIAGGPLTENVQFGGFGSEHDSNFSVFNYDSNITMKNYATDAFTIYSGMVLFSDSDSSIVTSTFYLNDGTAGGEMSLELDNSIGMVILDAIFTKGLVNAADYSANFTARSLIDKGNTMSLYKGALAGLKDASGTAGEFFVEDVSLYFKKTTGWTSFTGADVSLG